jgi:hypothetical protein
MGQRETATLCGAVQRPYADRQLRDLFKSQARTATSHSEITCSDIIDAVTRTRWLSFAGFNRPISTAPAATNRQGWCDQMRR